MSKFINMLADHVSLMSRKRKFELFMSLYRPGPKTKILDVGVADLIFGINTKYTKAVNFFEEWYPYPENITAVGLHEFKNFKIAYPKIRCVTTDGDNLPFDNKEFDIVFSNAVIEHVGNKEEQIKFIGELCRVSDKVFITTPNKWFPIETHSRLPFVHWIPIVFKKISDTARYCQLKELNLIDANVFYSLFPPKYPVLIFKSGVSIVAVTTKLSTC